MSRENWYRNTSWTTDVAEAFEAKLRRARNKEQYLRIQASYLTETHPKVALGLIDQLFAFENLHDVASAYCVRAKALTVMGNGPKAVQAYRDALDAEQRHPNYKTDAYLRLAELIVNQRMAKNYDLALAWLRKNRDRPMFPVEHYQWNGLMAVLLFRSGDPNAKEFAVRSLQAGRSEFSGFRHHPKLGLVGQAYRDHPLYRDIWRIAAGTAARWKFWQRWC